MTGPRETWAEGERVAWQRRSERKQLLGAAVDDRDCGPARLGEVVRHADTNDAVTDHHHRVGHVATDTYTEMRDPSLNRGRWGGSSPDPDRGADAHRSQLRRTVRRSYETADFESMGWRLPWEPGWDLLTGWTAWKSVESKRVGSGVWTA